jgi:preprotein translocase subunit SecE
MADLKKKAAKLSADSGSDKKPAVKGKAMSEARKKAEAIVNKKQPKGKKEKKKGSPIVRYFKEMRSELKKVVWPSRKKVVNNTIVVLGALVVFGIALWGVDTGFAALFSVIINGFGGA